MIFSSRTIRLEKRFLIYGAGKRYLPLLSPKKGWRASAEKIVFALCLVPSLRRSRVLKQLKSELSNPPTDFLLYYTGDYKNTTWIGVVQDAVQREYFAKVYKHTAMAKEEYEKSTFACSFFSRFFTVALPLSYSEHILCVSLLRKKSNVLIEDVWSRVVEQSLWLYHNEKKEGSWDSYVSWAPEHLRNTPSVVAHGDLSHWNCFLSEEGELCLIDYEEVGWYPPMYDCFHLLLKPTLLHRPADIPLEECAFLADQWKCSLEQVLVWMYAYLACENEKDRLRNAELNNSHIASTIHNRSVVQQECQKIVFGNGESK